jgi:hypothetical protein
MSYQILMVMPFLAIASCLALLVSVVVICTSDQPPRVAGFVVHERRKLHRALTARTPVMPPPDQAIRRAVGLRV